MESPFEFVRVLQGSLQPEVERPSSDRSKIEIKGEGDSLKIHVMASDISALRATLNSYLRWVEAIFGVVETVR